MLHISWDEATGYDFFASLYVLHQPEVFGLRASWAAGVRSRLPVAQREFLEKAQNFLTVPLRWLYLLPAGSRNAADAISALVQTPSDRRLSALMLTPQTPQNVIDVLNGITLRQKWDPAGMEVLRTFYQRRGHTPKPAVLSDLCEAWARPADFGERYLQALNAYYQSFFAEEEERIRPALAEGRARAEELSTRMPAVELLDTLSRGVRFDEFPTLTHLTLVPSYWSAPLVFYERFSPSHLFVLFGCRAEHERLVPGKTASDGLVDALKALADPTRLAILRQLAHRPATPSALARMLRLRPPTVIHHLNLLRLSGLVEVTVQPEGERAYALRRAGLDAARDGLHTYLNEDSDA